MDKNLPCNARDSGSVPGQGTQVSCHDRQLSPHASTTEPLRKDLE